MAFISPPMVAKRGHTWGLMTPSIFHRSEYTRLTRISFMWALMVMLLGRMKKEVYLKPPMAVRPGKKFCIKVPLPV